MPNAKLDSTSHHKIDRIKETTQRFEGQSMKWTKIQYSILLDDLSITLHVRAARQNNNPIFEKSSQML